MTGFSLEKPLYSYELDTWMENSEIYEFESKSDSNFITVVFILDNLNDMESFIIPKSKNPSLMIQSKGKQPTLKPDHSYELDTWAENSEVYEFTPRSRLDWTCQVYILDNLSSMSMKCFPKPNSIDYNLN